MSVKGAGWMSRRQMLRGFGAIAGSSVLTGCGSLAVRMVAAAPVTKPVAAPASGAVPVYSTPSSTVSMVESTQPVPVGAVVAASMVVSTEALGSVGTGFAGLAYEKSALAGPMFSASNSGLVALFKLMGAGVLCVGGSSVDESVWVAEGKGQVQGQIAPADVDGLAGFLKATGWSCVYGVNLGGSASGATTAALAAAEVGYVAQRLGALLVGVEIGNACERYGDAESYYAGRWSVEQFEALWKQYRDAIVVVTPNAPVVGPAAASDVDGWTIPFAEYVTAAGVGGLTQQYARSAATVGSAKDLLVEDPAFAAELLQLKYGAQSVGVPYRMTRCGAVDGGGVEGVSDAYESALWAVDAALGAAQGGASGLSVASGAGEIGTPLVDAGGTVSGVQPSFYGLLLASKVGQGTMLSAQMSAGGLNVSGYAVQGADGGVSVVVVNKDATQNLQLSLSLPASASAGTLVAMTQGAASGSAMIQGRAVETDGMFYEGEPYTLEVNGAEISCYVPALSAVLLRVA